MTVNQFGIAEPKLDCSKVCPVQSLDIIFTPLVAFDSSGNRLGMGGGFYDRTLAACKARGPALVGLAHQCQQSDALPHAPWDVPLHAIATPQKWIPMA